MKDLSNQTHWLTLLKQGDGDAATPLWHECVHRLLGIARNKLGDTPRRVSDEEDVAISAFHSFCHGAMLGKFEELHNSDDLWKVLAVIVSRKVNRQIEYLTAQKRSSARVRGESGLSQPTNGRQRPLEQFPDHKPAAEMLSIMEEEFEQLLDKLYDQQLKQIALLKLEGYTNREIADQIGRHARSIERKLKIIRDIWRGDLS